MDRANAKPAYFTADRDVADELERLRLLEQVQDRFTFRNLDALGVAEGWHCLDVGAGAGSVARWLADRVGPAGRVVAADLDTKFLDAIAAPNVEVRRLDIVCEAPETASYDLVHSRALLTHLRDPVAALTKLKDALRPGGWLLVEDPDYVTFEASDPNHPLSAAFDVCVQARIQFMQSTGLMNLRYGKTLPVDMATLGLADEGDESVTVIERGCGVLSRMLLQSFDPIDAAMVAGGFLSASAAEDARRALADPSFRYRGGLFVAVWGRQPAALTGH